MIGQPMESHVRKVWWCIGCLNFFFTVNIVLLVLNKKIKESSAGLNITNIHQGCWDIVNNPSIPNGINADTGASASTIAAVHGQTPVTFLSKINNEFSADTSITNNQQGGGHGC